MKKALLVATWEFRAAVLRRAYIFAVIAMPLLFFGIGSISVLTTPRNNAASAGTPTAIVDKAGIVDVDLAREQAAKREALRTSPGGPAIPGVPQTPPTLVEYDDEKQALADLAEKKVAAVYVIEADYLQTGDITAYGREVSLMGQPAVNQRQGGVSDAIRAGLLKQKVSDDVLARAYAPGIRIKAFTMDSKGALQEGTAGFGMGRFLSTMGVFMLLTMSIFFSAGFLQQATIEDRQNRVFEILLSSLKPEELILGKIMGLGAAGLLQVGIYVALLLGLGASAIPMMNISSSQLLLSLPYFVIGYLVFASCMAAMGMIGRNAQETAQLTAWWTLAAMAPLFFLPALMSTPNGPVARMLSFFPLTSPVTMLLRLTIGTDTPVVDIVASMIIGIVSVYLALIATTRVFRAATLMYGKRPTLPEFVRWLRAA